MPIVVLVLVYILPERLRIALCIVCYFLFFAFLFVLCSFLHFIPQSTVCPIFAFSSIFAFFISFQALCFFLIISLLWEFIGNLFISCSLYFFYVLFYHLLNFIFNAIPLHITSFSLLCISHSSLYVPSLFYFFHSFLSHCINIKNVYCVLFIVLVLGFKSMCSWYRYNTTTW